MQDVKDSKQEPRTGENGRHKHLLPHVYSQLLLPPPSDTWRADVPCAMIYQWQQISPTHLFGKRGRQVISPKAHWGGGTKIPISAASQSMPALKGKQKTCFVPHPRHGRTVLGVTKKWGDRSPWNMQETHMWPRAWSRKGMDASFCGIWRRSRSTQWIYPKGSVLAQDLFHRVIPVSRGPFYQCLENGTYKDWCFGKKTSPKKPLLYSLSVSSSSCQVLKTLWTNRRQKAKVGARGGRGIEGKETALGGNQVPILLQGPLLPLPSSPMPHGDHRTSSSSLQLGSKTIGQGWCRASHITEGQSS